MDRDFYLWANSVCEISCEAMKYIRKNYNDFYNNSSNKSEFFEILSRDQCLTNKVRKRIEDYSNYIDELNNIKFEMNKRNISFITIEEEEYPYCLREIYDPPYILYYYGNIKILKDDYKKIAIVGSRKGTDYGKNATKYFSSSLTNNGFIIVSGLAKNIDSLAHRYCIDTGGKTIAILGTCIDKIYPSSNTKLFKEIIDTDGLIISEHNYNAVTKPYHFALRNRLISGICLGVLVVEAEEKSGALITVDCALQQDRNVYSIPGSIFSSMSRGCNLIISQGAKLVQNVENILEDYEIFDKNKHAFDEKNKLFSKNSGNVSISCDNILHDDSIKLDISNEEKEILDIISSNGAINIEQLSLITGYDISDITYFIGKLCMMNLIVEQGFNIYAPNIL